MIKIQQRRCETHLMLELVSFPSFLLGMKRLFVANLTVKPDKTSRESSTACKQQAADSWTHIQPENSINKQLAPHSDLPLHISLCML